MENRWLVYRGLQVLNRRRREGFNRILEQAGMRPDAPITSETLGFTIGPRLNALGRLERADQGVELLTTDDPERARVIAAHLEFLNRKRRDLCDQTFLEAETHLRTTGGLGEDKAIILASPDWNPGIIGIVASRLIEKYHVPVFMMVTDESQSVARCSGRSIPGFHLHDELLALKDYFLHFGGHAGAGGFAIRLDRLAAFRQDLHAICRARITDAQMTPVLEADTRLDWGQLTPALVELVQKLAPFGMSNPSPRFVIENIRIAAQRRIGDGERHLKLILEPAVRERAKTTPVDGLLWNVDRTERFDTSAPYSFVVAPELNTFNGTTRVQLLIDDYRAAANAVSAGPVTAVMMSDAIATDGVASGGAIAMNRSEPSPLRSVGSIGKDSPDLSVSTPATDAPRWIDHRDRDNIGMDVSRLISALREKRGVLIYHEGKKPDIPFVEDAWLKDRFSLEPAEELVLWDLPPSPALFRRALESVKPSVLHLAGGKYRTVPVYPSDWNYLKLILQLLRREKGDSCVIQPDRVAARLAMTAEAILQGLVLLERMGCLETRMETGIGEPDAPSPSVHVCLKTGEPLMETVADRPEAALFRQTLREIGRFRGWLLQSGLATIKLATGSSWIALPDAGDAIPAERAQSVMLN